MSDTTAARLIVEVDGKDVGAEALIRRLEARLRAAEQASRRSGQGIGEGVGRGSERARPSTDALGASQARASRDALALAQAHARADAAAGNYDGAIRRLTQAMQSANVVNVRQGLAINQQIAGYQRATAAQREAVTVGGQLRGTLESFGAVASPAVFVAAAAGMMQFMQTSQDMALTTQKAQNSLEALSGSPALYAEALATAREQQRLFGGSLAENIDGVQGLVTVSRSSGVELQKLIDISQRLSVKDPSQGVAGARIALQEALSGDPTSLARRYEIPRKALAALRDESTSGADKIALIDKYLGDIGITSGVVAGSIPQATKSFNALNAELETMQLRFGAGAADFSGPLAQSLADIVRVLNQVGQGGEQGGGAGFFTQMAAGAASLQGRLETLVGPMGGLFGAVNQLATGLRALGLVQNEGAAAAAAQEAALAAHEATAQALAQSYAAGRISLEQYDAAMAKLAATSPAAAGAQQQQAEATEEAGAASAKSAEQLALEEVQSKILAAEKANLADAAQNAASAIIAGGGDIEATATRLAASSSQVDQLTAAYLRLMAAQGAAARAAGQQRIAAQGRATTNNLGESDPSVLIGGPGRSGTGDVDAVIRQMEANKQETEDAAAAQRAYQEQIGGTAVELQNLQNDLAGLTVGSAGYYETLSRIDALQDKNAKGASKRAGAANKEADKALKLQTDYHNKQLDAEQDFQQSMAEIAEDGAKKIAEAQRKYDLARLDSRAGFYRSLADIEDPEQQQQLSAAYEQAVIDAERIAREKGPDVAQAYLSAQEQALSDQAGLQADIAEAQKEKDAPRAEFLRGLLTLQQQADAERLRQIAEGNGSILAEQQAAYAEEQRQYEQHLEEMGIAFERKASQLPGFAATLAGPAAPAAGGAAPASSAAVSSPPSAQTAPGVPGAPTAATVVSDPATQAAIDSLGARLEGRLGEVVAGVGDAVRRLGDVEGAVRSLSRKSVLAP